CHRAGKDCPRHHGQVERDHMQCAGEEIFQRERRVNLWLLSLLSSVQRKTVRILCHDTAAGILYKIVQ
ncbi:hypothetical protein UA45_17405, partial [Morganella morganii]